MSDMNPEQLDKHTFEVHIGKISTLLFYFMLNFLPYSNNAVKYYSL